jgi:protein-S-isoprenylcysteine O-methyltransferase Ste14
MTRRTAAHDPWVWGQVILAAVVVFGVPFAARRWGTPDPEGASEWVALVFLGAGLAVLVTGIATLGRNLTPATEPLPDGQLVTRGLYRVVRHPIYLGVSMALAGYGFLRGGWVGGGLVFLVAVAYFERKARVEERFLIERMSGYEAYRLRVPRILPFGWH